MLDYIAKYIHGSEDSTDVDVHYVVEKLHSLVECRRFIEEDRSENRNVIEITDGVVSACYKGTVDEVNNGLIDTYRLHKQDYPLLVTRRLERDLYIKAIRAVRGIISHLSKSQYRPMIKSALRGPWDERLNCLRFIIDNFGTFGWDNLQHNMSGADVQKVLAFQTGQTLALARGKELYTKWKIGIEFPCLRPFLYREPDRFRNDYSLGLEYKMFVLWELLAHEPQFEYTMKGTNVTFLATGSTYNLLTETKLN